MKDRLFLFKTTFVLIATATSNRIVCKRPDGSIATWTYQAAANEPVINYMTSLKQFLDGNGLSTFVDGGQLYVMLFDNQAADASTLYIDLDQSAAITISLLAAVNVPIAFSQPIVTESSGGTQIAVAAGALGLAIGAMLRGK